MNLVDLVDKNHFNHDIEKLPSFRSGDTVSVHVRITEGAKSRIQVFQGTCIAIKKFKSPDGHFRVRKISGGMGVERVFPFHSPNVKKIEVISKGKTRRAKHYYLRERSGKAARIAVDYDRK
ncbi:MAG: 50S ribosomal protein L19 [Bacteriovoracaceae bacterium]|jgi:large subunit ribosomal protein L19|nr:50S ribosomal protein L19 [Bacteriovoracaceae bacterium]